MDAEIYDHYKALAEEEARRKRLKWFVEYANKRDSEDARLWDEYFAKLDVQKIIDSEEYWVHEDKAMAITRAVSVI